MSFPLLNRLVRHLGPIVFAFSLHMIDACTWSAPNHIGEILTELKTPLTNCIVRYGDDPCIEQFVNVKVNRKYSHTA